MLWPSINGHFLGYIIQRGIFNQKLDQEISIEGQFLLVLCADIEIYNWDGQTLYCFEACRVLITRAIARSTLFLLNKFLTPIGAQAPLIYLYTWLAYILL
jgi:hypothetical protein